jgi:hypothetical protein
MDLPAYVPTPQEGLDQLSPLLPYLQPALDNGLFKTVSYVEAEELNCDVSTFLTLVRAHVKSYLVKQKIDGIRFKDWSLSGIEFEINGAYFRCWKGSENELPQPGASTGRKSFLNQQYPLPYENSGAPKIRNFVVLYVLGPLNKVTLWLVCPKQYLEEERIPEAWWWVRIDEPASSMSGSQIGESPAGDLPIRPVAVPKTSDEGR